MSEQEDKERYLYRMGLLKKFVSSVLYLNWDRSVPEERWSDLVGAIAAGLAMGLTAFATHALGVTPAFNTTMVVTIVLIYIMKDRTKELVKRSLSSDRSRWLADLDTRIQAVRSGRTIGRCLETSRWLTQDEIPPEVEHLRTIQAATHRDLRRSTGETVLWYRKIVTLFPNEIQALHSRQEGVNDIIRLRVWRFMFHLDSAPHILSGLSEDGDEIEHARAWKTYSIEMVLRYAVRGHEPLYEKVRMSLDRKGIYRVMGIVPTTLASKLNELVENEKDDFWDRLNE
jgi:hypothetical protein